MFVWWVYLLFIDEYDVVCVCDVFMCFMFVFSFGNVMECMRFVVIMYGILFVELFYVFFVFLCCVWLWFWCVVFVFYVGFVVVFDIVDIFFVMIVFYLCIFDFVWFLWELMLVW